MVLWTRASAWSKSCLMSGFWVVWFTIILSMTESSSADTSIIFWICDAPSMKLLMLALIFTWSFWNQNWANPLPFCQFVQNQIYVVPLCLRYLPVVTFLHISCHRFKFYIILGNIFLVLNIPLFSLLLTSVSSRSWYKSLNSSGYAAQNFWWYKLKGWSTHFKEVWLLIFKLDGSLLQPFTGALLQLLQEMNEEVTFYNNLLLFNNSIFILCNLCM